MRISIKTLEAAVGAYLAPYAATNIAGCAAIRAADDDEGLGASDAGFVLAASLIAAEPERSVAVIQSCALVGVELRFPTDSLTIPAEDVPSHPLLAPWIAASLGDAVAGMILGGAILTRLAATAPSFETLDYVETEGCFYADVRMTFAFNGGAIPVVAMYGTRPRAPALSKLLRISGDAIFSVGVAVRRAAPLDQSPNPIPPAPEPVAAVTLH